MDFPSAIPASVTGLIAASVALGLCTYGFLLRRLATRGGRITTSQFGPPDAGLACFLITWFGWMIFKGLTSDEHAVTNEGILTGAAVWMTVVAVIAGFMRLRGVRAFHHPGPPPVILKGSLFAALLLAAAFPLVGCAGALMQMFLGPEAKPQELVEFFVESSQKGDFRHVASVVALGVLFAPLAEEFIFRGYLYPVLKKYLGLFPAMGLSAGLFAAFHLNLTSMPSLFILAVCFTAAYEVTGSILVPMTMHALFNSVMFCLMFASARSPQ